VRFVKQRIGYNKSRLLELMLLHEKFIAQKTKIHQALALLHATF
jgi:hypothetical protein